MTLEDLCFCNTRVTFVINEMRLFVLPFARFVIQEQLHLGETDWQDFVEFDMDNPRTFQIPDFTSTRL
jgi:hypothetical protein